MARIRSRAAELLQATERDVAAMPTADVQQLVRELQVRQMELNSQNDELRRTQLELEAARDSYRDLYDFSPAAHLTMDTRGTIVEANLGAMTLLGINRQKLIGQPLARFFASEDQDIFHRHSQDVLKTGTRQTCEMRLRDEAGAISWAHLESLAIHDKPGPITHWRTALLDITERKQAEALLAAEKKVLELIVTGAAMPQVLDTLMRETEAQSTGGMLCSVLLVDEKGQRLLHGAAPGLPPAYNAAVHGIVIGPSAGSCGTAAFERKPVFVTDIAADSRWADFKDLATAHGLAACCSTPILSGQDELLGTVAMYYRQPHNPSQADRKLIERAAQLAGIAIERDRVEKALRESEERYRSLVTIITDVPWVTDPIGAFIAPQPAWEAYTGQSWEQHRGFGWTEALHPDDRERIKAISLKVYEAKTLYESHGRIWHAPSGRWRYFVARATPLFNADGSVRQWVGTCTDVDDAKRSEAALRESEERFRSLVSNFPGAVYRCACDSDWTMEFLSDPIEHLCGHPASDFLASRVRSYNSVIHPNDRQMAERVVLDAVAQRRPYTIEYRLLHKDGCARWVQEKGQGIFAADGRVLWLDGAIFDITERKRAEEALRRSEVFISSVVENLPIMIFVKDAKDLTFVRFNKTGEELLGHSREVLIGKSDYDVFPKEQADFFTDNDRQVLQSGGVLDIPEEVIETKHQGLRILHTKKIPLYDDTGEPRYLVGISEDITERKRTEEQLKKSEDRYRSIFEKAVEGIFQTTLDGKYVAVNPALARIYGYDSPDDMIAAIKDIASQLYVDPRRREEFLSVMQAQNEVTGFEALVYRKDGSFMWISESARTLHDHAGTVVGYEGTVEDITERKRAEGRLRVTLDHVRTLSRRLATVQEEERAHIARELHDELGVRLTCLKIDLSRVMSLVGHRVRADLRAKLSDSVRSMVGQVDSTIASLQQLVTQLRPVLLDDLGLVAAIEWQSRDFQKRTGISCACVTNADDIAMEPERATAVFRICQEALTNTARHAKATAVTITVALQHNSLQLVVADNGIGIPGTKASDRRSLGLTGMQERAAQCGGTLTIEGDPEKGTTVTLCLPVVEDSLNHKRYPC